MEILHPAPQLCLITSPRTPPTLAATLQSLTEADPTWQTAAPAAVLLDSADPTPVAPLPPGLELHPLTVEEAARRAAYTPHQRCGASHARALLHDLRSRRDLIVFEDDLQFTSHWYRKTEAAVAFLKKEALPRFILALYSCHPWNTAVPLRLYEEHYPYFGAQAMFYTASVRPLIARAILDHTVENPRMIHCDLAIKAAVASFGIPLFALTRPVVQHIGAISHGISADFRQSPNFEA